MSMLFTIRTANRAPKPNYLAQTLASLLAQGVSPELIHIVATDPDPSWLARYLHGDAVSAIHLHLPVTRRRPNDNGLAQIDLLDAYPADWIVMSEDDLAWCKHPLESIERWLTTHATRDRLFYRFFAFGTMRRVAPDVYETALKEQKGSQVVAMRADDARRFAVWARAHVKDWRPKGAPFQDRPHDGFDKLLGYWALQEHPTVTTGLVSKPFFVRHLGVESAIHSHGLRRDDQFGGADWSYEASA